MILDNGLLTMTCKDKIEYPSYRYLEKKHFNQERGGVQRNLTTSLENVAYVIYGYLSGSQ